MANTFKFDGRYLTVETSSYRSNNTLALMVYEEGKKDEYDVITVNLNDQILQTDTTAFIDSNNNPWAERFLLETGIGEYLNYTKQSGFWGYPLYRIDLEKIRQQ